MTNGRGKEHGTQKSEGSGKWQRGKGTEIGDWLLEIGKEREEGRGQRSAGNEKRLNRRKQREHLPA